MIVYRLHSGRFKASDGEGAALHGGRWNSKGTRLLYTSSSISLAILEITVHYDVLPSDFVLSRITIPDSIPFMDAPSSVLVQGWDDPIPIAATRNFGDEWAKSKGSMILRVPSSIVREEENCLINVEHPDFGQLESSAPRAFHFDPGLDRT